MAHIIKLDADGMEVKGIVSDNYNWLRMDQWVNRPEHLTMQLYIYFEDIAAVEQMLVALQAIADGMAAKATVPYEEGM